MITSRLQRPIASACLTLILAASAAAQPKRVELNDLGREVDLVRPSARSRRPPGSDGGVPDQLYRQPVRAVAGTGRRRHRGLARAHSGAAQRRGVEWSPSGDRLAFIDREADKKGQLYVLPIGGGEARRITDAKRGVVRFAWRPDGQAFAFLTEDEPVERTGEEKHNKSFEVGDNTYLDQTPSLPTHLWTVSAEGGEATRVTSGVQSVKSVEWTPDGKRWLMSVWPRPHSGEFLNGTVVIRDVAGGAERTLSDRPLGSRVAPAASVSPDGRMVAHVASRGPELGFHPGTVIVTPRRRRPEPRPDGQPRPGRRRRPLASRQPRRGGHRARPDPATRLGPATRRGSPATRMGQRQRRRGPPQRRRSSGVHRPGSQLARRALPRRLTRRDAAPADRLQPGAGGSGGRSASRTITWQGPDGFSENGVVVYPPDFVAGRKYPLVLDIHGGPMATSTEGWTPRTSSWPRRAGSCSARITGAATTWATSSRAR